MAFRRNKNNDLPQQEYLAFKYEQADRTEQAILQDLAKLDVILPSVLRKDNSVDFLKLKASFTPPDFDPGLVSYPLPSPVKPIISEKEMRSFLRKNKSSDKHLPVVHPLLLEYKEACIEYEKLERARQEALATLRYEYDLQVEKLQNEVFEQHRSVDEFAVQYAAGRVDAVEKYFTLVLTASALFSNWVLSPDVSYEESTKSLLVSFSLPEFTDVPGVMQAKYLPETDSVVLIDRPVPLQRNLYEDVVSSIVLRILHQLFSADANFLIDSVSLKGFVSKGMLLSLTSSRKNFRLLNLDDSNRSALVQSLEPELFTPFAVVDSGENLPASNEVSFANSSNIKNDVSPATTDNTVGLASDSNPVTSELSSPADHVLEKDAVPSPIISSPSASSSLEVALKKPEDSEAAENKAIVFARQEPLIDSVVESSLPEDKDEAFALKEKISASFAAVNNSESKTMAKVDGNNALNAFVTIPSQQSPIDSAYDANAYYVAVKPSAIPSIYADPPSLSELADQHKPAVAEAFAADEDTLHTDSSAVSEPVFSNADNGVSPDDTNRESVDNSDESYLAEFTSADFTAPVDTNASSLAHDLEDLLDPLQEVKNAFFTLSSPEEKVSLFPIEPPSKTPWSDIKEDAGAPASDCESTSTVGVPLTSSSITGSTELEGSLKPGDKDFILQPVPLLQSATSLQTTAKETINLKEEETTAENNFPLGVLDSKNSNSLSTSVQDGEVKKCLQCLVLHQHLSDLPLERFNELKEGVQQLVKDDMLLVLKEEQQENYFKGTYACTLCSALFVLELASFVGLWKPLAD